MKKIFMVLSLVGVIAGCTSTQGQFKEITIKESETQYILEDVTNVSDELAQGYKEALIRSMFNQDEINLYKTNYYIGENNGGYLSYIAFDVSKPKTTYSEERIKYIKEIMEKENTDRRTIAEYLILSDPKLSMANIKEVESALYRRNVQKLIDNSYYQLPDSSWTVYSNENTNS